MPVLDACAGFIGQWLLAYGFGGDLFKHIFRSPVFLGFPPLIPGLGRRVIRAVGPSQPLEITGAPGQVASDVNHFRVQNG